MRGTRFAILLSDVFQPPSICCTWPASPLGMRVALSSDLLSPFESEGSCPTCCEESLGEYRLAVVSAADASEVVARLVIRHGFVKGNGDIIAVGTELA